MMVELQAFVPRSAEMCLDNCTDSSHGGECNVSTAACRQRAGPTRGSQVLVVAAGRKCGAMKKIWTSWCWATFLLLALISNEAFCRKGGGGRGGGGGAGGKGGSSRGGFHTLPKSGGSGQSQARSSSRGMKVAGAAAAGAAVGYGLSSLGRSRFSRGGHNTSNGKQVSQSGFQNPNWSDPMAEGKLYSKASKEDMRAMKLLMFSSVVCGVAFMLIQG